MKTILLLFIASIAVAETRITDVSCGALDVRSGKVEVSYTVTVDEGDPPAVLCGTVVDHVTGKTLADATLSGVRPPLKAGSFRAVWHMAQDVPNLPASRAVLRLRAEPLPPEEPSEKPTEEPPEIVITMPVTELAIAPISRDEEAIHLVIDLSGGPGANHYPTTILKGIPEGGWTDEYKTTKLVLRLLEPGSLTMGYHQGETPLSRDLFLHEETVEKPFFIGVFEVTQRQWELVMGNRPSFFKNDACYAVRPVEMVRYNDVRGMNLGSRWPKDNAVDDDSFLGRIRNKTGLMGADLPTSVQWEYACRAGTTTAMNNGRNVLTTIDDPAASEVCRYWSTAGKVEFPPQDVDFRYGTSAVGSFMPNAWGLYDMHGNVWEWCRDWLVYTPPPNVRSVEWPIAFQEGDARVVRGGSWRDDSFMPRSSYFGGMSPTSTGYNHGVRLLVEDVPASLFQ